MTAGMFHVNNLTPGSDNPTRGPLQQLMGQNVVSPEMTSKLNTSLADRPRLNLDVSAAAATVPHVEKTKEGYRAFMQREWGYGG
jgi:protein phosphatase PTC7